MTTGTDGQHTTHGSSYAYADPHWAEFYDLWIATLFDTENKPHEDVAFIWAAVETLLQHRPSSGDGDKKVKIIDVGTGTGRVVKSLVKCMIDEGVRLDEVEILGVDHGAA